MSDTVRIHLYFGNGEIIYGEEGVDLSNYNTIEKDVKRAGQRTWEVITNWLYKTFSVDSEKYNMSIMARINRSEPVFWELMPLQGTGQWRSYIRNAC